MTLECGRMRYAVVSHHGRDPIHVDPPTLDSHGMVNQVIEDRATLPKTKSKPPLKMPEDCNPKGSRIYSSKQENVHRRCMLVLGSAHLLRISSNDSNVDFSSITWCHCLHGRSHKTAPKWCEKSSARKPWANWALQSLSCCRSFANWPLVTCRYLWTCDVENLIVALS